MEGSQRFKFIPPRENRRGEISRYNIPGFGGEDFCLEHRASSHAKEREEILESVYQMKAADLESRTISLSLSSSHAMFDGDFEEEDEKEEEKDETFEVGAYIDVEEPVKSPRPSRNSKRMVFERKSRFSSSPFLLHSMFAFSITLLPSNFFFLTKCFSHSSVLFNDSDSTRRIDAFHEVVEEINNSMDDPYQLDHSVDSKIMRYSTLVEICEDFLREAEMYGEVILREKVLAEAKKTIHTTKGGILGGEKYVINGIYFKVRKEFSPNLQNFNLSFQ